uniref:Uncharacterized protein n=1 Tax=Anguilla anguilla TaxID=7936 RepID=A0A0E9PUS3_ANGAN
MSNRIIFMEKHIFVTIKRVTYIRHLVCASSVTIAVLITDKKVPGNTNITFPCFFE